MDLDFLEELDAREAELAAQAEQRRPKYWYEEGYVPDEVSCASSGRGSTRGAADEDEEDDEEESRQCWGETAPSPCPPLREALCEQDLEAALFLLGSCNGWDPAQVGEHHRFQLVERDAAGAESVVRVRPLADELSFQVALGHPGADPAKDLSRWWARRVHAGEPAGALGVPCSWRGAALARDGAAPARDLAALRAGDFRVSGVQGVELDIHVAMRLGRAGRAGGGCPGSVRVWCTCQEGGAGGDASLGQGQQSAPERREAAPASLLDFLCGGGRPQEASPEAPAPRPPREALQRCACGQDFPFGAPACPACGAGPRAAERPRAYGGQLVRWGGVDGRRALADGDAAEAPALADVLAELAAPAGLAEGAAPGGAAPEGAGGAAPEQLLEDEPEPEVAAVVREQLPPERLRAWSHAAIHAEHAARGVTREDARGLRERQTLRVSEDLGPRLEHLAMENSALRTRRHDEALDRLRAAAQERQRAREARGARALPPAGGAAPLARGAPRALPGGRAGGGASSSGGPPRAMLPGAFREQALPAPAAPWRPPQGTRRA